MQRLFIFGSVSLFSLFSLYTFSLLSLFYKLPISASQTLLSVLASYFFCILLTKSFYQEKYFFESVTIYLTFICVFTICLLTFSFFIDTSYDGQSYHLGKVLALEKKWNPIYENIFEKLDFNSQNKSFIQSYPNANSLLVFNFYKIFGDVEAGKGISFFVLLLSTIFIFVAVNEILKNQFLAFIFAFLAIINPVSLVQIFTFGIDTQFYSYLLILFSVSVLIYKNFSRFTNDLNFVITTIFLMNNKLTSIFYLLIFFFFFLCFLYGISKKENNLKILKQFFALISLSFFTGFLVYGYQPFLTNYFSEKDFFYPIKEFDFSENRPSNYISENQYTLFLKSIFFKSNGEFLKPKDEAVLKMPFSFSGIEKESFIYLGPKSGGFGVLFGGIIILLFLLSILFYFFLPKKNFLLFLFIVSVIIFSSIVNPFNNNARYIPQLWFLIPMSLLFSWRIKSSSVFALNVLIVFLTIFNSSIALENAFVVNLFKSREIDTYLQNLSEESKKKAVFVDFIKSEGNYFLLEKYNVDYSENCFDKKIKTSLLSEIGNSTSMICTK